MTRTHSHRYPHRTSTPLNTLQIKLYQRSLTATTPTYHEGYGRSHRPQPRPQHQLGTLVPPQDPEIDRLQLLAQQLPTVMHQNDVTAHRHHKGQNSLGHPSGPTPYTTHAHPASPLPTETSNDNLNEQRADLDHLPHHQSEVPFHKHDEKLHLLPHLRHHQRSKHTYPATASPTLAANKALSTISTNFFTTGATAGTSLQSTPLTRS